MRNLKRALSLALASVMVMGLAVVGSNASYVDVTSKQNQEAIEVLQKIGIMVGDENGKFNPEAKVTRNEMAVIMANLMDYRVASYKGTSPFTDVPEWAEPYVAACYTNGIVSGYDAKTFGGNDPVSTSQAALMLMKALGYFQYQSDFEDDWQLATVKKGNLIDLFDDVDSGVKESMTRNDVAQLVLNTLKSGTVDADNDVTKVEAGNVKVETGKVTYNYITSGKSYASAIKEVSTGTGAVSSNTAGYIVELGEKLYNGDLKLKDSTDAFGAPASRWTYKNEEIGTYADSADYTFDGVVKSNAFYDAVGKTAANSYTWSVYTDGKAGDGAALKNAVKADNKSDLDDTVRGSTTYVYLDDSTNPGTATVVVKQIHIAEITKVKDGTITIDDKDKGALDFDVEGYKEGDMVLYTRAVDGSTYEVEDVLGKAELKEGTVESVRDTDRISIDGTTYKYAAQFNDVNDGKLDVDAVDQKVSFYLDGQGNIIAFEDTAVSQDYAFVYSVGSKGGEYDDTNTDFGAKLVLTDGTVKSVTIDDDDVKGLTLVQAQAKFGWKIVSYSQNDDGTYSLTVRGSALATTGAVEDLVKNGTARVKGTNVYADKNTVYLINEKTDDGDDFNVYVGYDNVPNVDALGTGALMGGATNTSSSKDAASATGVAYYVKDGVAKVVVITDAEVSGSSNDVIFVVGNPTAKLNKSGSTEYYVYDAVVNGEVTSIKVKDGSDAQTSVAKITKDSNGDKNVGVFFGMTKNSNGYVTKLTETTPKDVEVNGKQNRDSSATSTYVTTEISTKQISEYVGTKRESNGGNLTFNTADTSKFSIAANSKATIVYYDGEDLSITGRVNTDNDDKATVITDDGTVIAILVREMDGTTLSHG